MPRHPVARVSAAECNMLIPCIDKSRRELWVPARRNPIRSPDGTRSQDMCHGGARRPGTLVRERRMIPTKESVRPNRTTPAGCTQEDSCAVTRWTRTGASVRGLSRESCATIRFKRLHHPRATARSSNAGAPHRPRSCPCASTSAATALAGRY